MSAMGGTPNKPKVAFIVQRCGREVIGGAELSCLRLVQHLTAHWDVEILTTCALDDITWANHYPQGEERINSALVKRFPVDAPRDMDRFVKLSKKINRKRWFGIKSRKEQEQWMREQGPVSTALQDYVTQNKGAYDAFFFYAYLYPITYFILPHVREKAWLVPQAHDEWAMTLDIWDDFFALPRGFVFQTPEEQKFLQRRFPNARLEGPVTGFGVTPPEHVAPADFREKFAVNAPFVLYCGRIESGKGCDELLRFFTRYKDETESPLELVLLGKENMPIPPRLDVHALGFVEEQDKWNAVAAAQWLVNPSAHESLSIVLLEAWSMGTPTLATEKSAVMKAQTQRSKGGKWYADYAAFAGILSNTNEDERRSMGEQGRAFVRDQYTWERITQRYRELLEGSQVAGKGEAEN